MAREVRLTAEARSLLTEAFINELAFCCRDWSFFEREGRITSLYGELDQQETDCYKIFERALHKIMETDEYYGADKIREELKKFDKQELFKSLFVCTKQGKYLNCFFCYSPPPCLFRLKN
jgi:hypothetical protein